MKKFLSLFAVMGILLLCSQNSYALSTEQRNGESSDGTSKFQDPDEQKPAFMVSPEGTSSSSMRVMPFGPNANSVTPPAAGDYDAGATAFDHAYSHLQNR